MSFRFHALGHEQFTRYFSMSPHELQQHRAMLRVADTWPGFPCRVSLEDASIGERVLLLNFEHLTAHSPFRASHAIYVREGAQSRKYAPGAVPEMFRSRQLSIRCFDEGGMLIDAHLTDGAQLDSVLEKSLAQPGVVHADVHFAKFGCFGARATRP